MKIAILFFDLQTSMYMLLYIAILFFDLQTSMYMLLYIFFWERKQKGDPFVFLSECKLLFGLELIKQKESGSAAVE